MGAMTQFVPVWSGTALYSRRLAWRQFALVVAGLLGLVGALFTGALAVLPWAGLLILGGFWTFAYNVGYTLSRARPLDVTEGHFAVALSVLVVQTTLGVGLAVSYAGLGTELPIAHANLRAAHATLAVLGVVLTTVIGALYQLATVFTATELHGVDHHLRRFESVGYPAGVALLAGGRLVGVTIAVRLGGALLAAGLLAFVVLLGRKLVESRTDWTAMRTRYAVVAVALGGWALVTGGHWASASAPIGAVYGPGAAGYLLFAAVGFVLLGTLYHVVPFLVWVETYADRLGLEQVPMVEDLYDARLARGDLAATLAGSLALIAGEWLVREPVVLAGLILFGLGALAFVANMVGVLLRHAERQLFPVGRPTRSG
jgi:hypothetical protein